MICELFDPVCRPSGDPGDGKQGSIEFSRKTEHRVNKSAVEVDVCRDALVDVSLSRDKFSCKSLDSLIEGKFLGTALLCGKLFDVVLEDDCSRI